MSSTTTIFVTGKKATTPPNIFGNESPFSRALNYTSCSSRGSRTFPRHHHIVILQKCRYGLQTEHDQNCFVNNHGKFSDLFFTVPSKNRRYCQVGSTAEGVDASMTPYGDDVWLRLLFGISHAYWHALSTTTKGSCFLGNTSTVSSFSGTFQGLTKGHSSTY